ncbi:MAG: aspartate carbamoyltransferase [Chloroflexi bacterium]|nr:aspartate carbamoyltransferase [Chloroflexota bacterium]
MAENRSLVTIDDLSNGEINALFAAADEMSADIYSQTEVCRGRIMASLFFEPSTRTRLSFEAAMLRLGGSVITAADVGATSLAKGESIADMARVVGSYADIIVIRHPWEGAAKVVADYAGIPVINAGDGGHEHPTQTLCDLYTLNKERGGIRGLKIALWGDLKYGRTIHSLTFALARFGATIHFRPGPGLEMPEHVLRKLSTEYKGELKRGESLDDQAGPETLPLNAMYVTPSSPHQLAMMPDVSLRVELQGGVDALYVTRLQKERLPAAGGADSIKDYPVVNKKLLQGKEFEKTLVMHPLPRIDELAHEMDADARSMYFKQAARGVPVRMALIAFLLQAKKLEACREDDTFFVKRDYPVYRRGFGVRCANPHCVSVQKSEVKFIKPEFKIISERPLVLRCGYCEHELNPPFVASTEWHEGRVSTKKYHSARSQWTSRIKMENLIIFGSEHEARVHGFTPSHFIEKETCEAGMR